ncbi:MAG TPA: acyltransferase [Micromonosporaceae bacterium]
MRRVRQLAEQTPAYRERFIDLLRGVAIIFVVLGHWSATVIEYDADGRLTGYSALPHITWAYPLTWLFQVMPIFFLVGGFANAASLNRHPGDSIGWLQQRSARLVRPTVVLMVTLAGAGFAARLLGVAPDTIRQVVWFVSIPLWFLTAYLAVVLFAPVMYALHRRFGLAVPLVLAGLVALGDLARLAGSGWLGRGSFLFGWLAVHQLGFVWWDARTRPANGPGSNRGRDAPRLSRTRVAVSLLLVGLGALLALTLLGPYPISMINVPGERLHNVSPPTLALLALATAQFGLILLLRDTADRWLHRPGPWRSVIAVNAVILTVFLWHVSAALLVAAGLHLLGRLVTPPVGSADWWLWRLPWLALSALVLAVLVAVLAPYEARSTRRPSAPPRRLPGWAAGVLRRPGPRAVLTVAGFGAVVVGLLLNSTTPPRGDYLFGLPMASLLTYLLGAGLLRVLYAVPERARVRSGSGSPGSPRRGGDPATGWSPPSRG